VRAVAALGVIPLLILGAASAAAGPAAPWGRPADSSLVLISSLDAREELSTLDRDAEGGRGGEHGATQMFLFSLAVPGSGQLVQGEKRGYLYLAAEAAFWTGFFVLNGDGLEKRDEYEAFADDRWDYEGYETYYTDVCLNDPDAENCRPLAERYSQEFYEDIGKYSEYWDWWIVEEGGPSTPHGVRDVYWQMRKDSNRDLRRARYFVTAAFLNHLVSAVDAFLSARRPEPSEFAAHDVFLEFDAADPDGGLSCAVVMRY
jgi:hypothetical protein